MAKLPGFTDKERAWLEANGYGDMTRDVYEEIWVAHLATDKGANVDMYVYKDAEQKTWAKMDLTYDDEHGGVEFQYTAHGKTLQESVRLAQQGVQHYTAIDYGL